MVIDRLGVTPTVKSLIIADDQQFSSQPVPKSGAISPTAATIQAVRNVLLTIVFNTAGTMLGQTSEVECQSPCAG